MCCKFKVSLGNLLRFGLKGQQRAGCATPGEQLHHLWDTSVQSPLPKNQVLELALWSIIVCNLLPPSTCLICSFPFSLSSVLFAFQISGRSFGCFFFFFWIFLMQQNLKLQISSHFFLSLSPILVCYLMIHVLYANSASLKIPVIPTHTKETCDFAR